MSVTSLPGSGRPRTSERVAAEVRALMGRYNVTQMDLTRVLGVSQTGISKRLRGITPFDADEIGVLAHHFGVSPSVLFGEATPPDDGPPRTLVRSYRLPVAA
jgi:transcriptional regulator with XRE-family HTH domain